MNPRVQGRRGPLWSIQPHRPAALVAGRSVIYSRLPSTSPTLLDLPSFLLVSVIPRYLTPLIFVPRSTVIRHILPILP